MFLIRSAYFYKGYQEEIIQENNFPKHPSKPPNYNFFLKIQLKDIIKVVFLK